MKLHLQKSKINTSSYITLSGSKSETNRLLLLQALYPQINLQNISNSDDSQVMTKALNSTSALKDIHHAGTAMRFLTAYFAIQEGKETILTGSTRMKERPIKTLVDALLQLGANITYQENEGFPPIKITGKKLTQNKVSLPANISSQYISALLLIAPQLQNGLELTLEGEITSIPYIKMTLALLNQAGITTTFQGNHIKISPKSQIQQTQITVESDWSSASYWYSFIALSETGTQIKLANFKQNSLQGDAILSTIYQHFGVQTVFNNDHTITITKKTNHNTQPIELNLNNAPDIAQTIVVTCLGIGIGCNLYGLHTLKIKETDRLEALKIELTKLNATITVTSNSLHLKPSLHITPNTIIKTYQDHRMAMAFAPLALRVPITIDQAEVVSKSYPNFWKDLEQTGISLQNEP